jgi:diguanylate cyclase (GGDEF)-like protein
MASNSLKKLSRHLLRQALDAVAAPALILDAQHRDRPVVYANAAFGRAVGLHPNEILGRSADSLADLPFDPAAPEPWRPRSSRGPVALRPVPLYEQPGRAGYWLLTSEPAPATELRRADGPAAVVAPPAPGSAAGNGVFMATDVWARSLREDRADATTGIPGRNALLEVLLRDWTVARRESRRLSVIVFRIDGLESYHRLFGRHATEACLRKVAHSITNSLQRAADYCARVGHDRFAVLIGGAEEDVVAAFAERIAQRVRDLAIHHPRSQHARYVTVSWSVASEIPAPSAEEPALLEDAEARITAGQMGAAATGTGSAGAASA